MNQVSTICLDGDQGQWRLQYALPGAGEAGGFHQSDYDDRGWIAAPVPGDNYTAMRARGVTYGQFIGRDKREDPKWIEKYEWWYRRSFYVPGDLGRDALCRLTFDGLDTLATVYLNGRKLLRHENMHTPVSADVTDRLIRGGRNVLAVQFDSGHGRNAGCPAPPVQIRTCGTTAYGSYFEF